VLQIGFAGRFTFVEGYSGQFRQPTIYYRLHVKGAEDTRYLKKIIDETEIALGLAPDDDFRASSDYIALKISRWTTRVLEQNNHPVCQSPFIKAVGKKMFQISQPCLNCRATAEVVVSILMVMTGDKRGLNHHCQKIKSILERTNLEGFNQFHFIKNAHEINIPWEILPGGTALLGWGENSRWLESSFTDSTPSISAKIARNKALASTLLRRSGLPVPEQIVVTSKDMLLRSLESIDYPVVVKPYNMDGGIGVKAHLTSLDHVIKAYDEVSRLSDRVLLEKHVAGNDYRLQVVNGELHGVLERKPGGVIGNGIDQISELVKIQNNERKYAQDDRKYLHPIVVDDEAESLLESQGLDWSSIPEDGLFVRLRGACNVASGGVPEEIPLDKVHSDNKFLAINAANVMRLDVAGIDLLIPDIGTSWRESGAYICEVNAQPQMFTSMHGPMLRKLFENSDGRVPVVLFLGVSPGGQEVRELAQALQRRGVLPGFETNGEIWIGSDCVHQTGQSIYDSVKVLTANKLVQCILFSLNSSADTGSGWPVDKIDYIVVGDSSKLDQTQDYHDIVNLISSVDDLGSSPTLFCPSKAEFGGGGAVIYPSNFNIITYNKRINEVHDILLDKLTAS